MFHIKQAVRAAFRLQTSLTLLSIATRIGAIKKFLNLHLPFAQELGPQNVFCVEEFLSEESFNTSMQLNYTDVGTSKIL